MAIDRVRHRRQIRLVEIGEAGQERLSSSEVALRGTGDVGEVEAAYLVGAGLRVTEHVDAQPKAEPGGATAATNATALAAALSSLGVRDTAASDVAQGALLALLAMRDALGLDGGGGSS
jgi:hypothetical protein